MEKDKRNIILGIACLIGASQPMLINAQNKIETNVSTNQAEASQNDKQAATSQNNKQAEPAQDSIQTMRERLRQDSILWEKQLETVTIKGTRSQFRQKDGGIIARISGTSLEKEPTTTDVLCKLPGIIKKDNKPQSFLGGAPEIYINDRKVQDYSVVENLPVSQIKEVKVIHHPGAEYGTNVGCVLLITTKRNLEGLAIVVNSGLDIDRMLSNQHDLDLTYSHGKLTYYGKVGYANWQGYWTETDTETNYSDGGNLSSDGNQSSVGTTGDIYRSSSTLDCKHHYTDRFYWSAGTDLSLSPSHTLGVKYDGYTSKQLVPFLMTSFSETNGVKVDEVIGHNKFIYDDWQHHVNAFYQGKFGEKWKLNIFGDYVKLHTGQGQYIYEMSLMQNASSSTISSADAETGNSNIETNTPNTETGTPNIFLMTPQTDNTVWGGKARANYSINDKQTLVFGGEYNYIKSDSRLDYEPTDQGTPSHNLTKENHAAFFAEYTLDFKPFQMAIGLRYEHVDSKMDNLLAADDLATSEFASDGKSDGSASLHRKYDNLFPTFRLTHTTGRFSQTLSYRAAEVRPSFRELNTGSVYVNRYIRQMGNSELEPSKRHELQYQATYRDFFLQASYTYVKDYITMIIQPEADDPQSGYLTWKNTDHCSNWGAFLGYRHRWGWYEPQVQAGVTQGFLKAESMGKMKSFHDPYYVFNIYNGLHLPWGIYANLSWNYRSSGTYEYSKMASVNYFDFSLYKSFLHDRLSLYINVHNLLNNIRMKSDGTYGHVRFEQDKKNDFRGLQIRVTYRFNQAKKQYQGENTTDEAVGRMGR